MHFPLALAFLSRRAAVVMKSTLQYWLVDHPTIHHFTWTEGQTPASSPIFLTLTLLSYLSLTLLLTRLPLPPLNLRPISALHNLTLLLLSLIMAVGCTLSILSSPSSTLCLSPSSTTPTGPLFFWAYLFYLSKLLELLDTLFIILSGSLRRLTFLHVYHHATVLLMCYLWLRTRQSLFPVALVTNASVHVLMYAYYFLCAVGVRPRWKRAVTDCQIVQFVFSFAVSGRMLYMHFSGSEGCSGIWGWCFNAVFNASLLALFLDFHGKSYAKLNAPKDIKRYIFKQKKRESIFAVDVQMLCVIAEVVDGVDAILLVHSIFSENVHIGLLLLPHGIGKFKALIFMFVDYTYRLELHAIDDSVEEILRALKL